MSQGKVAITLFNKTKGTGRKRKRVRGTTFEVKSIALILPTLAGVASLNLIQIRHLNEKDFNSL